MAYFVSKSKTIPAGAALIHPLINRNTRSIGGKKAVNFKCFVKSGKGIISNLSLNSIISSIGTGYEPSG
jgi:short subunit fatty acids transporter